MIEHYIIVKFTEGTDVKALVEPVRGIFEETLAIPGVDSLDIRISNSDIANRYDLMIIITMEKEALPAYAASEPHMQRKQFLTVTSDHNSNSRAFRYLIPGRWMKAKVTDQRSCDPPKALIFDAFVSISVRSCALCVHFTT